MKIKWKSISKNKEYWITEFVADVTWSGADTHASRSLEINMVNTPFDSSMKVPVLKGGDIITFYDDDNKARFEGRVVGKEKLSEVGTRNYIARDYMHNLIQSKASYVFKKKTPEYITRAVCKDLKIKVGTLVSTKKKLKKYVAQGVSVYDIIYKAFRKAKPGTKFLLAMNGTKLTVVKRGGAISGYHLDSTRDIINMETTENADSMINQVVIYNKNNKKVGVVKNADWVKTYGIYQDTVSNDKKKKRATKADKKEAKKMLDGVDKKSTVEAIGDIRCVSGRAVTILDTATGTTAEFWIKSDTHTWENGIHTMTLELKYKKTVKSEAVFTQEEKTSTFKRTVNSTGKTEEESEDADEGITIEIVEGTEKAKADAGYKAGEGTLGWPCTGNVIKKYKNQNGATKHLGIDIKVASGTKIRAAEAGTVTKAGKDNALGKKIVIKHANGLKTIYGCCSAINVKKDQKVKKGDVIAKAGSTGEAKKPQCHFGVQKNGVWKDPENYLK